VVDIASRPADPAAVDSMDAAMVRRDSVDLHSSRPVRLLGVEKIISQ